MRKKVVPNCLSNVTKNNAIAIIGNEKARRNETANVIQVNTGILINLIPLVLMLRIVVMKLNAETRDAIPRI